MNMYRKANIKHRESRTALKTLFQSLFQISAFDEEAYLGPFFSASLQTYEEHVLEDAKGKAKDLIVMS